MQQTGNGDPTVGGTIQPVYGALTGNIATSDIKTVGVVSSTAPRPHGEVFGFAFGNSSLADPTYGYPSWSMNLLTTIAYFGLSLAWDGSIVKSGSGWTTWNSSQLTGLVSTAHANGVRVILSVNLHVFSSSPTSDMCSALYPTRRATTISQIAAQVSKMGVDGVNLDYEGNNTTCQYGYTLQSAITSLAKEFRAKLPKAYIAIDTYSGSAGDTAGFFNIANLEPYVDAFFVMAYDMEYSNYDRPPLSCSTFCIGPTSPLTTYHYNLTSVMDQYRRVVPASKVILGLPYYGRKECVANVTPATAPPNARAVSGTVDSDGYLDASTENGYSLNSDYHKHREVHDVAGYEPWDTWTSSSAHCTREMYWDDVASLGRKYDLVNKDALGGVGIFALQYGGGAPELWQLLQQKFVGCTSASLTPVPGAYPVGAAISFTAGSTGCDSPRYQFWVKAPGGDWKSVRAYSTSPNFTWSTAGLLPGAYEVSVWARQLGSRSPRYDAGAGGTYDLAGCGGATLAPAPGPHSIGETIAFTAGSTGCPSPEYQFWIAPPGGAWKSVQAYSSTPTYSWRAVGVNPGTYQVAVWVRQHGSGTPRYDVGTGGAYTLSGCGTATLSPAPGTSFSVGGTAAFSAGSTGCASPEYSFWVRPVGGSWTQAQAYSANAAFNWNTTGKVPGSYEVSVRARQVGTAGSSYNAGAGGTYKLTGCASAGLTPAPGASFHAGAKVAFTASSTGCSSPEYSFWVRPVGGTWKQMQSYSSTSTFTWNTTGLALGQYEVAVRARQHGSGSVSYDAGGGGTYTLIH